MASEKTERISLMRQLRDTKVREHLSQYAPVWLVSETPLIEEDTLRFTVAFFHPRYKWVSRRYRYDAFNDVLYYHGQRRLSEEDALAMQDEPPYIPAESINTVESYGG